MTITPLSYLSPRAWVEAQPATYGSHYDRAERRRIYTANTEQSVSDWGNYFFGRLVSQALRYLNTEHYVRRGVADWVASRLRVEAVRAGRDVEVTFTPGDAGAWAMLDGELSSEWLDKQIENAVEAAIDHWNPQAARDHSLEMSKRAKLKRPNRKPKYPATLLAPLAGKSAAVQSEILGIKLRTIKRMRSRLDLSTGVLV